MAARTDERGLGRQPPLGQRQHRRRRRDPPRVVRTLLVGDEPRDIVFAGPTRAATSARLHHHARAAGRTLPASVPADLTTEGTPRALVWVFDATNLGATLGGTPLRRSSSSSATRRARSPRRPTAATVYAAVFHSGNQTTTVSEGAVCNGGSGAAACVLADGMSVPGGLPGGQVPGGLPAPNSERRTAIPGPETGLIVKFDPGSGELGGPARAQLDQRRALRPARPRRVRDRRRRGHAGRRPPRSPHVGTVLFNMLVNPTNGKLYVTNTEARNEVRFEGPGSSARRPCAATCTRRASRCSTARHRAAAPPEQAHRRAAARLPDDADAGGRQGRQPGDAHAAWRCASDGTLYVAAFGSSKVGIFATARARERHLHARRRGPHRRERRRADRPGARRGERPALRAHALRQRGEGDRHRRAARRSRSTRCTTPSRRRWSQGRPFLYDARLTSSNGEASCSSCHVFGDFDSLAWDLGNPDDVVRRNPNPVGVIGEHASRSIR